jgi:protein-disulfide isomerase
MHDRIFESQREWSSLDGEQALDAFLSYAEDLELDSATFAECLETGQFGEQIAQDVQEGRRAGVGGTPWFLINDRVLAGAYPFEAFRQTIEEELRTTR